MIDHKLIIVGTGDDPRPEVGDFEVLHIIYQLDTFNIDETSNTINQYATTGLKILNLRQWDINNKTPGAEVTNNVLEQWVMKNVNLEKLKENNIANLKPVPNNT